MNWLASLFSVGTSSVIDSVGTAIDKLVTSDDERLQLKNALIQIEVDANNKAEELALQADKEITLRWTNDNEHLITRLVRPISFAWVIFLFSVVMIGDTNWGFHILPSYIPVLETLLVTMVVAYFGSRGAEKITKNIKGKG